MAGHPPVSLRLTELLEAIKQEFVSVSSEASAYLMHKDEFDHKLLTQHVNELQQVRKTIYELDIAHRKMKEQYEDEIHRLKRQLEARSGPAPQPPANLPGGSNQTQNPAQGPPPPGGHALNGPGGAGAPTSGLIGNQMPGAGVPGGTGQGAAPSGSGPGISSHLSQPGASGQQAPGGPGGPGFGAQDGANSDYNRYYGPSGPGNPLGGAGTQAPQVKTQPGAPNGSPHAGPGVPAGINGAPAASPAQAQAQVQGQTPGIVPGGAGAGAGASSGPGAGASGSAAPAAGSSEYPAPGPIVPPGANNGHNGGATNGVVQPASLVQPPEDEAWAQAQQLGNNLAYLNLDQINPDLVKRRDGWLVVYNERAPRKLDVDIVHSLEHSSVVCCVRFSQDGKYLATGCNRSAQIYDVQTGQLLSRLQDESIDSEEDLYIRSVCFSPDATLLATGAEDHQIRVWDVATQKIRHLFTGHEQDIYSLDISRNGRKIASGSGDGTVRIWDLESGQCVLTLSIEGGVTAVSISPDGRFVAAGSLDHIVRVWDTETGFLVERLEAPDGHENSVYSVTFTADGQDLVSGSLDKTIKLWELQATRGKQSTHQGGVNKRTIMGHKDYVLSVATTPDGQWILSGSKDRGVQFWDPRNGQAQLMLQAHKNSVISVAPSPVGGLFATGSGDFWAKIWRYTPV